MIQKMRKLRCKKEAAPGLGSECGGFETTLAPPRPVQQLGRSKKNGADRQSKVQENPHCAGWRSGEGGCDTGGIGWCGA